MSSGFHLGFIPHTGPRCNIINATFKNKKLQLCSNRYLKDLKAGDVQDADEGRSLSLGLVQSFVDPHDEPAEHPLVRGLGQGLHSKLRLFLSLGLLNVVSTDLDSGRQDGPGEVRHVHAHEVRNLLGSCSTGHRRRDEARMRQFMHEGEREIEQVQALGAATATEGILMYIIFFKLLLLFFLRKKKKKRKRKKKGILTI